GIKVEKILERALAHVDSAEVYFEDSEQTPVRFKSDELHSIDARQTRGVGLRVIKDGRIGFSSTSDMSRIEELIDAAVESSRFGQEAKFGFPGKSEFPEVKIYDKNVVELPTETAVNEGKKLVSMVKDKEPEVKIDAQIRKTVSRIRIVNSCGLDYSFDKTYFTYFAEGFLLADGSFVWIFEGKSKCSVSMETEKFGREILWKSALARKVVDVPDKAMTVLFMPDALTSLFRAFAIGVNGKNVQKGSSPLLNRVGESIVGEEVTIWDDGLLECGIGSSPMDAEGVPSTRSPLIEDGVLKGYIFDLQTAGLMGVETTGNAARRYNSMPVPGMSNFCVSPGTSSVEEMVKNIKEGVVVYDVLGGGQSNLLAGDFSVNVSLGFKVENGEMVGRVKDIMIAGNVYDVFNRIVDVGKEVEEVWGFCSPAFCFSDIRVASKAK
ncbi:MAG: TldD/PmbA family protein, partial [bacterium]